VLRRSCRSYQLIFNIIPLLSLTSWLLKITCTIWRENSFFSVEGTAPLQWPTSHLSSSPIDVLPRPGLTSKYHPADLLTTSTNIWHIFDFRLDNCMPTAQRAIKLSQRLTTIFVCPTVRMVVHHNTSATNATWPVAVVQRQTVLAVKCWKSSGAIRHSETVHSLQRLHKSGTCAGLYFIWRHIY